MLTYYKLIFPDNKQYEGKEVLSDHIQIEYWDDINNSIKRPIYISKELLKKWKIKIVEK